VESNSTVSNFAFNQPNKEISFYVTGPDGTIGFSNVTIPKQLLYGEPWSVLIDGISVTPTIAENETHSILYFTYIHSTHKVQIIGTHVITPPPPPLSASISPLSASILVGQSVAFTSTVSGGYTPYGYQWYLNEAPVSGANATSWTFTPTTSGIYYVYLKVTDAKGNTAQSETARITVATVPVGGYSFPIQVQTKTEPVLPYIALIAILTIFMSVKRKAKRETKEPSSLSFPPGS
jgi:PKD repeat protein